jgi:DNA polymerase III epsilon subunit family exonuclease
MIKDKTFSDATYCVIDFETTGTSPKNSRAIEIGIVKIEKLKIVDSYQSLINPNQYIPPFITSLTGIDNNDILDAPSFDEISDDIKNFIDGSILVGHNLPFDYAFLKNEFERSEIILPTLQQVCTLKLSRSLFPKLKSKALGSMVKYFKIRHRDVHRALGDATATAKIFLKIIEKLANEHNYEYVSDLNNF